MSYHQFQMFEKIGTEESQIETSIELSETVNLFIMQNTYFFSNWYRLRDICPRVVLQNLYNALIIPQFNYCILCWGSVISENHSLHILQEKALRLITNRSYISHTEPLCKELRVLKVFVMFYVAVWKFYYKLMHNDLPLYFSAMKPTLPTVCRRYEIRTPMFHFLMIRHTFAEHSIRFCLINLLNKGWMLYLNKGKGGYRPIP